MKKEKRISPIEATLNLYDGLATDYPFDRHSAFLELYFTTKPEKPADKPKKADEAAGDETENPNAESEPPTEEEVPIAVDFFGSIAGFKIAAAKSKESDESYVGIDMKVSRSGTVIFFSTFVMFLMWAMTIAVMILVLSILLRGRKVEITMFSFIAALLFAFAAIRNNQPGIPPIGTYSDFIAFFWAEVILSLCLLTILTTWLLRPAAK